MLRALQWTAVLAALVFFLSVTGIAYYSSPPAAPPGEQQAAAEKENKQETTEQHPSGGGFIRFLFPDSISIFTFWLVVATVALAAVAVVQIGFLNRAEVIAASSARAAKDAADVAKQTFLSTQRPFVFLRLFETVLVGSELRILPQWENSGVTPAMEKRNWANWKAFIGEPPPDYAWPDLDAKGEPLTGRSSGAVSFLGPKATQYGEVLKIPLPILDIVRRGERRLFIWGWTEYLDTLDSGVQYRTEFCNEMTVTDLGTDKDGRTTMAATYALYGPYNRAN